MRSAMSVKFRGDCAQFTFESDFPNAHHTQSDTTAHILLTEDLVNNYRYIQARDIF